jgi:hypothetical protein
MATALTNEERLDSAEYRLDEIERMFKEAFPHGDHIGHERYHLVQIEMLLARRKLVAAIQEKTIGGIVWAVMVAAGIALWQWFKHQVLGS